MQPGLPSDVGVRPGGAERDPADRAMHRYDGGRRVEPAGEPPGIPERPGPAVEVGLQQRTRLVAPTIAYLDGWSRALHPHSPAHPIRAAGEFDHQGPIGFLHQAQRTDGRLIERGFEDVSHVSMQPTAAGGRR